MLSPFTDVGEGYRTPSSLTGRTVKTKCMCTLGPALKSKAQMAQLLMVGMNVARLQASHGDIDVSFFGFSRQDCAVPSFLSFVLCARLSHDLFALHAFHFSFFFFFAERNGK